MRYIWHIAMISLITSVLVIAGCATSTDRNRITVNELNIVILQSDETISKSVALESGFLGSSQSTIYHYPHCSYVKRIRAGNIVYFATRDSAKAMGYRGCRLCKSWRDMNPGELPHGR